MKNSPGRRVQKRARGRNKPQPRRFRPTAGMQRFLRVELELLARRRPYTQKQVAEAATVSESQASRWHDVTGYDDWMTRELRHVAVRLFARGTVAAGYRVIMTGDPKELETFGRVMGLISLPVDSLVAPGTPENACVVNLLVPRPEYPVSTVQASGPLRLAPPDLPTQYILDSKDVCRDEIAAGRR